jgi:hypothetical protein
VSTVDRRQSTVRKPWLLLLGGLLVIGLVLIARRRHLATSELRRVNPPTGSTRVDVAHETPSPLSPKHKLALPRFAAPPSKWANSKTGWYLNPWGFGKEDRDEPWATAMEAALRKHFAPELRASVGLERLELIELSCRATMCRVRYRYPDEVLKLLTDRGLPPEDPMVLVAERIGPLADRSASAGRDPSGREESILVGEEPYTTRGGLFGFTEETADPARHEQWARERVPQLQKTIERIRERWQARQAARAQRRDGG